MIRIEWKRMIEWMAFLFAGVWMGIGYTGHRAYAYHVGPAGGIPGFEPPAWVGMVRTTQAYVLAGFVLAAGGWMLVDYLDRRRRDAA